MDNGPAHRNHNAANWQKGEESIQMLKDDVIILFQKLHRLLYGLFDCSCTVIY